jgi:hypothetical protein
MRPRGIVQLRGVVVEILQHDANKLVTIGARRDAVQGFGLEAQADHCVHSTCHVTTTEGSIKSLLRVVTVFNQEGKIIEGPGQVNPLPADQNPAKVYVEWQRMDD